MMRTHVISSFAFLLGLFCAVAQTFGEQSPRPEWQTPTLADPVSSPPSSGRSAPAATTASPERNEAPPGSPGTSSLPSSGESPRLQLDLGQPAPSPGGPEIRLRSDLDSQPGAAAPQKPSPETISPQADPRTNGNDIHPEPAAFNGVTPGQTTVAKLLKQWGQPKDSRKIPPETRYLFEMPPFSQVEVIARDNLVRSIVVRLEKSYPANLVAQHLELSQIRAVYVSNPQGEILGQAFPERGVIFAFAPADQPGKASNMVTDIILEELSADPFVLRAETFWDSEPESAARDLAQALKLDPQMARAWWLLARVQRLLGQTAKAQESIQQAVTLSPQELSYRLELAQILLDGRQTEPALAELQQVVALAEDRPHLKAKALCLIGDVYHAAEPPDFKKALDYHYEAIKVAQAMRTDPFPAYRVAAKEVLVDAHLGAAKDIAWGVWERKEAVVNRWLERAEALAQDLVQTERQPPKALFKTAATALAVSVALPQAIEAQPWLEKLDQALQILLQDASPHRKAQIQWDYGAALYDAVQHFQARQQHDLAAQYGEKAIAALEQGLTAHVPDTTDHYLLGRLYFRLGAVYAIAQKKHTEAIPYYDKAIPHLEHAAQGAADSLRGRLGETFVSMAVSYWETGQKERAVELTEKGIQLMEQAVKAKQLPESALSVPHANLRTMREALGRTARSDAPSQTPLTR